MIEKIGKILSMPFYVVGAIFITIGILISVCFSCGGSVEEGEAKLNKIRESLEKLRDKVNA
jgi:hypothetical protein